MANVGWIRRGAAVGLWILVVAVAAGGLWGCTESRPDRLRPREAPDFTLPSVSGETVTLSDHRGEVVLLHFWATWCPPCKVAIPHEVEWQEKYGPQGFTVMGLSLDRKVEDVREFLEKTPVNYPMLMVDKATREAYGGVTSVPLTILIDRQGTIRKKKLGYTEEDARELEDKIREILGESAPVRQGA